MIKDQLQLVAYYNYLNVKFKFNTHNLTHRLSASIISRRVFSVFPISF